jgi:hypothetical protein
MALVFLFHFRTVQVQNLSTTVRDRQQFNKAKGCEIHKSICQQATTDLLIG